MIKTTLIYYCDNVFILMNIWMVEKKSIKHPYLNMEDITDADYAYAGRVFKDFEIKNLVECHDLYVQIDILLLADLFEHFRNMCLKLYKLDFAEFFVSPWFSMENSFKKSYHRINVLTDVEILLMVQKAITGGICHSIY